MVANNLNHRKSVSSHNRAVEIIPGGVNSPVRAFRAVGGCPLFIDRACGERIRDVDGNEYIDYIGSWGPMIAGHAHPKVIEAITEAAKRGSSFGVSSEQEIALAEEINRRIPSIDKVRFVNSGTEAAMSAIRLARAYTHRSKIVKFAGCYHGHADQFLTAAGSGAATLGLPDSPGVTAGSIDDTIIAQYNDLDSVEAAFEKFGEDIASVLVEPVAGNMGVIPPESGFLQGLRDICDKWNSLLVFDEVMTGFRIGRGGAQALYNIKSDLTLLGKIIGGGLPVGAFGGRGEIMDMIAPSGPVYQAGTLSGNPLAMSAGLATLTLLDDEAYRRLEETSHILADGLETTLAEKGIKGCTQRVGSMLTMFFASDAVCNFDDAKAADHELFASFFRGMLQRGVLLPPSGYEAWFVSLAHDHDTITNTIRAASETLREIG